MIDWGLIFNWSIKSYRKGETWNDYWHSLN